MVDKKIKLEYNDNYIIWGTEVPTKFPKFKPVRLGGRKVEFINISKTILGTIKKYKYYGIRRNKTNVQCGSFLRKMRNPHFTITF